MARREHRQDFLRTVLFGYNILALVAGCGTIGFGIWLLTQSRVQRLTTLVNGQLLEETLYLLITGGGALTLLAVIGVFATKRGDKRILGICVALLLVVLVIFGVTSGRAFSNNGNSVPSKHSLRDQLTEHYGVAVLTNPENRRITDFWDSMQSQLGCCGVSGNVTSTDSWAFYSTNTLWYMNQRGSGPKVPESCCRVDTAICTGQDYFPGPPNHLNSPKEKYNRINPYLYTTGCYERLLEAQDSIMWSSFVVGVASVVVAVFLVCGIILSITFCIRKQSVSTDNRTELTKLPV